MAKMFAYLSVSLVGGGAPPPCVCFPLRPRIFWEIVVSFNGGDVVGGLASYMAVDKPATPPPMIITSNVILLIF